jgi:hypothetical protein
MPAKFIEGWLWIGTSSIDGTSLSLGQQQWSIDVVSGACLLAGAGAGRISACRDQPVALFAGAVMSITMVSVNPTPLIWNA